MKISKYTYNYYLILFSILPISIIIGSSISLINILIIDISFLILIINSKNFTFLKNKTLKYFIFLYIYLIFNSFISLDYTEGIHRNLGFLRMIILFVAFNYFFNLEDFSNRVFKIWLLILVTVLIDIYIESYFGRNILGFGESYGNRVVSFFKDEPIVGGYVYSFYLLIIGFLFCYFKKDNKYFIILFSLIFLFSIILTGERSNSIKAFIGISFLLLIYKEFSFKFKTLTLVFFIFLIFISILNSPFLKSRFVKQLIPIVNTNNIYYYLYNSGFHVFKENIFFGVGNKNYRIKTCNKEFQNSPEEDNFKFVCSTHPHQIYFEFLAEHGLIGSIILFFIFFKLIFFKIKEMFKSENYIYFGSLIYLILTFMPILPSGAFFSDYLLTLFIINLSILYGTDKRLNLFKDY
tara:strand:+ start:140 stop:1360 length:1221 start_codon:yes stop_codon:yes gene_type:complete